MKKRTPALSLIAILVTVAIVFSACRKINEATELGGDLIPPIDNISTFETYLDVETDNKIFNDSTKVYYNDYLALGHIGNDPEFGATHADAYFNVSSIAYPYYPFINKDSAFIDSVVLSLSYNSYYGDTNSFQTLRVFEIDQMAGFNDTSLYKYNQADFQTTGGELGSKTFQIKKLKDSILHIRRGDTTKLANVIRIPLTNLLGQRFIGYDTTRTANGAYNNDSAFKKAFRGLAIKADNTGNALTYITPADPSKTSLIVYFRVTNKGIKDTISAEFTHRTQGQANIIKRTPNFGWATYLNNGIPNDNLVYLQSVPGSYTSIKIPGLDTFRNAVIHRAELVVTPLASTLEGIYSKPIGLFLDHINSNADTAFTFDVDMDVQAIQADFDYNFTSFGGGLRSDSTYRFKISKYVQDIITLKAPNHTLRLFAPVRAFVFSKRFNAISQMYISGQPAYGRVVLGGGNYAINPEKRMRLRIVYSKL